MIRPSDGRVVRAVRQHQFVKIATGEVQDAVAQPFKPALTDQAWILLLLRIDYIRMSGSCMYVPHPHCSSRSLCLRTISRSGHACWFSVPSSAYPHQSLAVEYTRECIAVCRSPHMPGGECGVPGRTLVPVVGANVEGRVLVGDGC
jgi:hypothetical protein